MNLAVGLTCSSVIRSDDAEHALLTGFCSGYLAMHQKLLKPRFFHLELVDVGGNLNI